MAAVGLILLVAAAVTLTILISGGGTAHRRRGGTGTLVGARPPTTPAARPPLARRSASAVGLRTLRFIDASRTIQLPDGRSVARTLTTYVRYPALGPAGASDLRDAPAARAGGPFPLVVFAHGFAVTPAPYARLLQAWTRAGYVVAAPVFPLENANAPGGPNESDLVNQPADVRFLITSLLSASRETTSPLAGLIDAGAIAVSGQSDGGDTALAAAFDPRFRDRRIDAAIILSGAEIPAEGSFAFAPGSPPLLATQGTADTINPPSFTETFFAAARPPKYLLRLLGAEHLPPYTSQQPQLAIVERVSIAFLDGFLRHSESALRRMPSLGEVPGTASLLSMP
jgi:fermentation-respiration switch protein FrsA (DUF1100 family)